MPDSMQASPSRKTMPAWAGLVLLLIGGMVGAIGATMVVRTINLRHAYPRAVMTLMNTHVGALKKAIYHGQCSAAASSTHLQRMRTLADTIKPAFHALDDSPFMQAAAQLQHALVKADATPLDSCTQLRAALSPITDACQSCHRKFR